MHNISNISSSQIEETPRDSISPSQDVFSYFMLASPTEKLKHHRFTLDACMSYVLVFVTLFIQGVMLYCVWQKVIFKNMDWRNSILSTGNQWNLVAPASAGCNDGSSLCTFQNGTYTCAPPSVQLIGRWDELDLNKDGTWTLEEVMKARDDLKCKYVVDPVEIFHVLIALLKERAQFIWLAPHLREGKAIPKTYFTYIMGDVAMCGYRNADMCGNILKKGFFDEPLKTGKVPRIGNTVSSALEYCQELLAPRGLCERILPSTYSTWKIESVQECQRPEYSKFVHKHPGDGSIKSLLEVDYNARQDYEKAQTPTFILYKGSIVFMWIIVIIAMGREVGKGMAWVTQLPEHSRQDQADEEALHSDSRHPPAVHSMSMRHRVLLFVVFFLRIIILGVLFYVGLTFLGRQTDYIDLLLDGVALIFIVDVAQILYERLLRQDVRDTAEAREPIEIVKVGVRTLTSMPDVMDILWFLLELSITATFMWYYTSTVVHPLYNALQCTCLGEGEHCREAHTFSKGFWDNYWSKEVPSSIQEIKDLKLQFETGATEFRSEFASNILKYRSPHTHLGQ